MTQKLKKYSRIIFALVIASGTFVVASALSTVRASATIDCNPAPLIYSHSPSGIEKYNLTTGQFTTITNNPSHVLFDIGVAPNGTLYGVVGGGGSLFQIDKTTGVSTAVGTVTLPASTNFNMLAFDRYGKGSLPTTDRS